MLILEVDLLCQMLAQRLNAVGAEIIVEIPELRLEHDNLNPDFGCSGGQPLRRTMPRRIAVDGDVEALQPCGQQDSPEVRRRGIAYGRDALNGMACGWAHDGF